MKDITDLMAAYRQCICRLWNQHLRTAVEPSRTAEPVRLFHQIRASLFQMLVADKIGHYRNPPSYVSDYDLPIFVQTERNVDIPILIERDDDAQGQGRYWDHPVNRTRGARVEGRLVDFFDWDELGEIKLQFFHVEITEFEEHDKLVGLDCLLEAKDVRVVSKEAAK